MNYVYDLVLNYCELDDFYEFYEWDSIDKLTYVQEIPIFKIHDFQMNDLLNSYFKISYDFLEKIYKKTRTIQDVIPYSALFTDSFRVYAFLFDKDGNLIQKSSLFIDEEKAVIEELEDLDFIILDYKIIKKFFSIPFLTRHEKKIQSYLLNEIQSLYANKNYDEIDFLYQEFFSGKRNIHEKYYYLLDQIQNYYCNDYSRLYDIIQLTYSK